MLRLLSLLVLVAPFAASAQEAGGEAAASQYASFIPLLFIFGVFYILLIRPQQKKMKEHQVMLGALQKGDEVITGGGVFGKITKVEGGDTGTVFVVEIAKGVEIRVLRSTVSGAVNKEVPVVVTEKKKSGNKNDNSVVSRENVANDN